MTKNQEPLYWRVWGQARKADPSLDRKALHAQPSDKFPKGLPESHTLFRNDHLDEWISRCGAVSQPANFNLQNRQVGMDATRGRVFLRHLLSALEKPEEWLEGIVATMHRNHRVAFGKSGVHLDALDRLRIDKLIVAVKKECRRTWKTKDDLLGEIYTFRREADLDDEAAATAVLTALNQEELSRGYGVLVYEDLLIVLSALRRLAVCEHAEIDIPF